MKDGLPANEIFTINQDRAGFMWFGSNNGVFRYDGYYMHLFRKGGTLPVALPDNQITALLNDTLDGILLLLSTGIIIKVPAQNEFIFGQDLSYVNMMEDCGAVYREDSQIKDVYHIFADNGTNLVRVRLWHNPDWQASLKQPDGVKTQYSDFSDVKETIFRAKGAGMKVMLDFHFSDFWCDPGRQILPKAWEGVSGNETALKDSVYNYVYQVLDLLNKENLMPEYVKIGNESNSGIMTHKGMNSQFEGVTLLSSSWSRHARLYNEAIRAVRNCSANTSVKPKIALHVAKPENAEWFYNNIRNNGVTDFDIMGFTYYYAFGNRTPAYVGQTIRNLKNRFSQYEVMVVETGYPWDNQNIDRLGNIITQTSPDYQPVSPATQKKFMVDLTREVIDAGGTGVIFWEPAWVSTPCSTPWGTGSSQEHVAFFDHRNNLTYMKNGGGGWPMEILHGSSGSKCNITFKIDMKDHDVSRGVYVVGTMTGWTFVKLSPESGTVYQTTLELIAGESHAYYFITSDNWTNYQEYRETVPEECALSDELLNDPGWTSDRAFIVPVQDTTITTTWSSCETRSSNNLMNRISDRIFRIYPNPSYGEVTMNWNNEGITPSSVILYNSEGRILERIENMTDGDVSIVFRSLENGIYWITLETEKHSQTQKLIILN